jgi:hypothetical protein
MAVAELPRPGIEVIQVFRTTSPTILNPTLAPVIVGVCRQVVDAVVGGVINSDALVSLPAFFLAKEAPGTPAKYTTINGVSLTVSVNRGPDVAVAFSGTSLSPTDVVSQVNKALKAAGVTEAVAEVVGDGWRLRTLAIGETAHLKVVAAGAAVATAFNLVAGLEYEGVSSYQQNAVVVPAQNFPDPNSNLTEVKIEDDSVKAYLGLGTGASMRELRRTASFLRRSGTPTTAKLTGSVDISALDYTTPGVLDNATLTLEIDGATVVITFDAAVTTSGEVLTTINTAAAATVATMVSNFLVLTSPTVGGAGSVKVVSGTAVTILGFTAGQTSLGHNTLEALDDGNGDSLTPLLAVYDAAGAVDLTAASPVPAAAVVTATGTPDLVNIDNKTLILSDGRSPKTIEFGTVTLLTDIVTAINAAFDPLDGLVASDAGGGILRLTSTVKREDGTTAAKGSDSQILILGGTAVNGTSNYLDTAGTPTLKIGRYEGTPYPVAVGDEVWADGKLAGKIVQIAPGGQKHVVKMDKYFSTTFKAMSGWYIDAKNLTEGGGVVTRPKPELIVEGDGTAYVKTTVLRDPYGKPVETTVTAGGVSVLIPGKSLVYLAYKGVRQDVSAKAKKPSLLAFADTTELASIVPPVTSDSPMSLGTFFALLNAPGSIVNALGVDDVSADAPNGTLEAFTRAFEFLEAVEVYAIAPMTNDPTVGQVALAHVAAMSLPESKGERVAIFNSKTPTAKIDTLVASGNSGSGTPDPTQFDTGIANLGAILIAQGLDPSSTQSVDTGLYLDIATDSQRYSIESISGSVVTVRTTSGDFTVAENDDDFYAEETLPAGLINEPFALRIRGAALTLTDGTPDKLGMAKTMQEIGKGFANRRFWNIVPDKVAATIGGLEQELDGFYMTAAIAGMIAQQPPQQSFTNFPMNGFTRVIGSNDFFTEKQLNIIAAGGNWIVMQEGAGTPLFSRMALTTDLTSIETRTDSITKVVDFTAKFLRTGLKNFIGRFNVTQGFLDSLGHVVQGLGTFLMDTGVLIGFNMNNIIQDADAPDTVLIDCTLDVPFPCNYIRLTLVI